jgi:hypothetical protein
MPYRDPDKQSAYMRDRRERHRTGKSPGRPPLEDQHVEIKVWIKKSLVNKIDRRVTEAWQTGANERSRSQAIVGLIVCGFEWKAAHGDEGAVDDLLQLRAERAVDSVINKQREAELTFDKLKRAIVRQLEIGEHGSAANLYWELVLLYQEMAPTDSTQWFLREAKKAFPDLHQMPRRMINLDVPKHDEPPQQKPLRPTRVNGKVLAHNAAKH